MYIPIMNLTNIDLATVASDWLLKCEFVTAGMYYIYSITTYTAHIHALNGNFLSA